ncbi:MAG: cytochrome c biogenesis protein CcdA [Myxococcales bacterium]|nr:cytochrome c biogenesis protein CcdA [Myxococcales bacterium]
MPLAMPPVRPMTRMAPPQTPPALWAPATALIVLAARNEAQGSLLVVQRAVLALDGVVIIVFGLHMMGIFKIGWLLRDTRFQLDMGTPGFFGSFTVGAGFGFGWSPCIGPILGAVLTLAGSRDTVFEGIALLAVYSAGLGVPFLLAGWSIEYFFEAFHKIKHHLRKLEFASGMVLVGVGILLVSDRLTWLNSRFSFMNEWISAAEKAMQ